MEKQQQKSMFPVDGKTMGFAKKEFKSGRNYSVRLGIDWATDRKIQVGDLVSATNPEREEFFCEIRITHVVKCRLIDIQKGVIKGNSDPHAREGIGLVLTLQKHYNRQLHGTEMVTCIGFEIAAVN